MKLLEKYLLLIILLALNSTMIFSQVSINNNDSLPHHSAMLDISSTDRGLLIPRMTETQRNQIINAATGLMVYQLDNETGFYYWSGGTWLRLTGGVINMTANTLPKWDGTKLVNSAISEVAGNVGIGTTTSPASKLDINGPIRIQDGNQAAGKVLTSNANGTASWQSLGSSNISAGTGLSWSGNTLNSMWTQNGNIIFNNNSGNVGIGTSAPTAQLDVNGKIRGQANVAYSSSSTTYSTTSTSNVTLSSMTINLYVQSGDIVKADLSCNLSNTSSTTYMSITYTPTSFGIWLQTPNWATCAGTGWKGGYSTGIFKANSDGIVSFTPVWHVSAGTGSAVYCNMNAYIIGKN